MKMTSGFLSEQRGIFGDSNEKNNDRPPKRPMKMIYGLLSRIKGIFIDDNEIDDGAEDDNNPIISNRNPII